MSSRWSGARVEDDGVDVVVTRDALFNGIAAFAAVIVVMFTVTNPETKEETVASAPPGNITIEAFWPDEYDADVDLWVKGPTGDPVGYSNKGGEHYNLLRDDLGKRSDDDPVNYEVTYSRGIPEGAHCVNLHLYRNNSGVLPMPVRISVTINKGGPGGNIKASGKPGLVSDGPIDLLAVGKEKNVFCFLTDDKGDMVKGEDAVYQSDAICLRSVNGKC